VRVGAGSDTEAETEDVDAVSGADGGMHSLLLSADATV
jgi:hypothetical protein